MPFPITFTAVFFVRAKSDVCAANDCLMTRVVYSTDYPVDLGSRFAAVVDVDDAGSNDAN
jgi:hypothetical protein